MQVPPVRVVRRNGIPAVRRFALNSNPLPADQEAFLRSIVAQPEDDTTRLVYADWLEEHGDAEQAAFIRSSIEVHNLQPGPRRTTARDIKLQKVGEGRGRAWLAAVGVPCADELSPYFHRGCVEGIECESLGPLFAAAGTLFALFPIRELYFWWQYSVGLSDSTLVGLAEMPGLERLRRLHLANYDSALGGTEITAEAWGRFFRCPRLAGLRSLRCEACRLGDANVEALADAPSLAGLTILSLTSNRIGVPGVWALLRSPYLRGVTRLSLEQNVVTGDDPALQEELERRFPGQDPLRQYDDEGWFAV